MIGLVAHLKVQAGKEADFETAMAELKTEVQAKEPGCVQYDMFKHTTEENTYVMMEQYKSQDDLDAHMKTPHFQAAVEKFGGLLGGAPVMHFLASV